jgi:3-oxoacyl-[acyl-carrier protein] reductase
MNLQMDGDRILVVGASEGIGYATALLLAEEGATLSIASRRPDAINHAADEIEKTTGRMVARHVVDVTDRLLVSALVDSIGQEGRALDGLVIATGGSRRSSFEELSDEDWLDNYTYNILGPVRLIRGLLPALRRGGAIRACCCLVLQRHACLMCGR